LRKGSYLPPLTDASTQTLAADDGNYSQGWGQPPEVIVVEDPMVVGAMESYARHTGRLLKNTETIRRLLEDEGQKGQLEGILAHHCSYVQQWMRALCETVDRADLLWAASGRRVAGDDVGTPAAVGELLKGGGIVGVSRLFLLVILLPGEGLCFEGESMLDEDLTESPAEGGGDPAAYTRLVMATLSGIQLNLQGLAGVKILEQQDSLQSSSSLAVRRALEMLSRIEAIDRESLHEVRRGIGSVQQELTLLRYERKTATASTRHPRSWKERQLATQLHSSTGALETPKKQILATQKKDTVPENKLPICERPWFNAMMGVIIALNAIEIGIQTDAEDPHHLVFETLNIFFVLIYIAELTVRIYYNRAEYFSSAFNIFDCVLVIKTIIETFILSDSALKSLLSLRLVRMIRLIRMVRLLRFFRELWLVFTGVIAMLKTLAWVALLLFSLTWVCAIILRMVLGQSNAWSFTNRLTAEPYEYFDTYEYFGTPWAGLLTLFQVTTQDHWMVSIARPVGRTYPVMWLFFLPYLFITAYAILNVMLSSIVNNAIDAAKANDKQLKIQKSRAQAKVMLKLRRIFEEIDVDENGKLDKEELDEAANNPKIISLLAEINMPVNDLNRVFECLDADGDGEVNRDEFLHGCAKVRGEPKARDVNRIPIYIQSLASRIDWYEQKVDALADEVLFILEHKMREAGVDANYFERRQGSSAAVKALDHLALAGVTAADRVRGLELEALEALRREALKRSIHRAPNEFGVNLNEVRIDRSHIPFSLPIGGENLLRTLPSMKLPPAKTIDLSKEGRKDDQRSVEPCVAHLPTLPPPPKPPPVVSILEICSPIYSRWHLRDPSRVDGAVVPV
ncbi:hypothetical protein FOZ62_023317, partial [Perkinsus olseni]